MECSPGSCYRDHFLRRPERYEDDVSLQSLTTAAVLNERSCFSQPYLLSERCSVPHVTEARSRTASSGWTFFMRSAHAAERPSVDAYCQSVVITSTRPPAGLRMHPHFSLCHASSGRPAPMPAPAPSHWHSPRIGDDDGSCEQSSSREDGCLAPCHSSGLVGASASPVLLDIGSIRERLPDYESLAAEAQRKQLQARMEEERNRRIAEEERAAAPLSPEEIAARRAAAGINVNEYEKSVMSGTQYSKGVKLNIPEGAEDTLMVGESGSENVATAATVQHLNLWQRLTRMQEAQAEPAIRSANPDTAEAKPDPLDPATYKGGVKALPELDPESNAYVDACIEVLQASPLLIELAHQRADLERRIAKERDEERLELLLDTRRIIDKRIAKARSEAEAARKKQRPDAAGLQRMREAAVTTADGVKSAVERGEEVAHAVVEKSAAAIGTLAQASVEKKEVIKEKTTEVIAELKNGTVAAAKNAAEAAEKTAEKTAKAATTFKDRTVHAVQETVDGISDTVKTKILPGPCAVGRRVFDFFFHPPLSYGRFMTKEELQAQREAATAAAAAAAAAEASKAATAKTPAASSPAPIKHVESKTPNVATPSQDDGHASGKTTQSNSSAAASSESAKPPAATTNTTDGAPPAQPGKRAVITPKCRQHSPPHQSDTEAESRGQSSPTPTEGKRRYRIFKWFRKDSSKKTESVAEEQKSNTTSQGGKAPSAEAKPVPKPASFVPSDSRAYNRTSPRRAPVFIQTRHLSRSPGSRSTDSGSSDDNLFANSPVSTFAQKSTPERHRNRFVFRRTTQTDVAFPPCVCQTSFTRPEVVTAPAVPPPTAHYAAELLDEHPTTINDNVFLRRRRDC